MLSFGLSKGSQLWIILSGRGLTPKTIRHFGMGYSLNSRFGLVDYLKRKGYTSYEIVQSNVAFESRTGKVMDRFFSRVMFPIIDLRGNVVGFGGRVLTDEKPKYLNTSDTLVFKKSNGLFAMNFAKNSNPEQLILVEGYMDVIALHQAGFPNAVATLGTALTSEQAKLMARYVKEVVILMTRMKLARKRRVVPFICCEKRVYWLRFFPSKEEKIQTSLSVPLVIKDQHGLNS